MTMKQGLRTRVTLHCKVQHIIFPLLSTYFCYKRKHTLRRTISSVLRSPSSLVGDVPSRRSFTLMDWISASHFITSSRAAAASFIGSVDILQLDGTLYNSYGRWEALNRLHTDRRNAHLDRKTAALVLVGRRVGWADEKHRGVAVDGGRENGRDGISETALLFECFYGTSKKIPRSL
jgi:hypothetical protein